MPKFTNTSPQGDLDLPLIGRTVAAGETFEATDEQAKLLALQPDLFKPAHEPRKPADTQAATKETDK